MRFLQGCALLSLIEKASNSDSVLQGWAGSLTISISVWPGRVLNHIERKIWVGKKTVLCAKVCENSQAFLFFFSKAEPKMFAVIAGTELRIKFCLGCDQLVEISEVFIAQ